MIQPAAPSLLAPAPARPFPRQPGGAAFALPSEGGDDAAPRADSPTGGGEDRHDDAVPGNLLPVEETPAPEPSGTATSLPIELRPSTPMADVPPPIPMSRLAKFELSSPASPSRRLPGSPTTAPAVAQDPALDTDEEAARTDQPGAMGAPMPSPDGAVPIAPASPVATTTTPATVCTPPVSALPSAGTVRPAPIPAMAPRSAIPGSAPPAIDMQARDARTIDGAAASMASAPAAPLVRQDAASPSAPVAATPTVVPASALATSSLTPLRRAPIGAVEPPDRAVASPLQVVAEQATGSELPSPIASIPAGMPTPLPTSSSAPARRRAAESAGTDPDLRIPDRSSPTLSPLATMVERHLPPAPAVAVAMPPVTHASLPANWLLVPPAAPLQGVATATATATEFIVPSATLVPVDRPLVSTLSPPMVTVTAEATAPALPANERRAVLAAVTLPHPGPPVTPSTAPAPAGLVFGAARFAAQVADDRDAPATPVGPASLAPASLVPASLAAPAMVDRASAAVLPQAPVDLRQERWPHAMIERIEMIRDAADAVDTRVRLIPDALGAIDVEVKRDGDTLNVRFHAEQAQTRTLLADAAPRLAEAAESRGLRLGQSSVGADAGSPSQDQQRQPLPTAAPPRASRSPVADADRAADDARLA